MPDFDTLLEREAREGWRLVQIVQLAEGFGYTSAFVAILERLLDADE